MLKPFLAVAVAVGFAGFTGGCAHVDRERAEYHREKAERAAEHGRVFKAAHEERKANAAERDAETDPLP
jgi:hypothetical protein